MKYYLLHIPVNEKPVLHGPLLTEVAVDLKQPDITGDLNFGEYDQLICLAVTGHGEIVRAQLRDLTKFHDECEVDGSPQAEAMPTPASENRAF